jgi:hypothetical protein
VRWPALGRHTRGRQGRVVPDRRPARHHPWWAVRVTSARSQRADQLTPAAVVAMAEVDLNISCSREYPKPLTTSNVQAADVVITIDCGSTSPGPCLTHVEYGVTPPLGCSPHEDRAQGLMCATSSSECLSRPRQFTVRKWRHNGDASGQRSIVESETPGRPRARVTAED